MGGVNGFGAEPGVVVGGASGGNDGPGALVGCASGGSAGPSGPRRGDAATGAAGPGAAQSGPGAAQSGETGVSEEVLLARAYLSRVAEPGNIAVWAWVGARGPVDAAASIQAGQVPATVASATAARAATADPWGDLDAAARHGIRLLTPESAGWPHLALAALGSAGRTRLAGYRAGDRAHRPSGEPIPPLALWVRGELDLGEVTVRSAALVGARSATAYGEQVAAEFGYGLASQGVTIVSGGAYGIDVASHRGALAAGGVAVLVSAGGLDRPYPAGHARLFEQVASSGVLVSESPPGAAPQRHRFLSRNRLIAALGGGTVVIEAGVRSGALNTARHARELGRVVMAVPGPVTSELSVGCHRLLREGAEPALLVTCVDDILAVVGSIGEGLPALAEPISPSTPAARLIDSLDRLDPTARLVFDGLPARGAVREDELALRCGVAPLEVIRALPALRLAGLVEGGDDGFRISAWARAGVARRGPTPPAAH
ncbi:MAG: DNA-processing protein DprA [Actinomycetia bacterium]|nr:DNA-processing protein DprA [Actinomycetes bacterium]